MSRIRKAVIPAAGFGTRFLPATKAIPKEMLPIVDKPAIQYIVEEAIDAGIEEIIIVTSRNKKAIEDHFDRNHEIEHFLVEQNKTELLNLLKDTVHSEIQYVRQKQALGLGHAVWCARQFIGDEPFAVLLGDVLSVEGTSCLKQLIQTYEDTKSSVIAVHPVDWANVSDYGIVSGKQVKNGLVNVDRLVEKPKTDPPSNLAIIGRYILEPAIFPILERLSPGEGGELQLTDALQELIKHTELHACMFTGKTYDVGNKLGYLKATVELALEHETLQEPFTEYLHQITSKRGGSLE